jgi:hypothetical protein
MTGFEVAAEYAPPDWLCPVLPLVSIAGGQNRGYYPRQYFASKDFFTPSFQQGCGGSVVMGGRGRRVAPGNPPQG